MCIKHLRYAGIFALLMGGSAFSQAETPLTLDQAVSLAQSADPWLERSRHRQKQPQPKALPRGRFRIPSCP